MPEPRPLTRCMGGRYCSHAPGTCTATTDPPHPIDHPLAVLAQAGGTAEQPPAPMTAGMAAWVIRRIAERVREIPGTYLALPDQPGPRLTSEDSLVAWLDGLATSVQNGATL